MTLRPQLATIQRSNDPRQTARASAVKDAATSWLDRLPPRSLEWLSLDRWIVGSLGVATAVFLACASGASAQTTAPRKPGATQTTTAKPSPEFAKLLKAATDARQAERWDEAIGLYAKLVKLKPDYVEGYWYQGTAYYTQDDFPHCKEAFRKVISLAPKNGAAYAFLGLCEFGLKEYDRSLQHLLQSRLHGIGDVPDLGGVARYHAAILMSRMEQFEQALETLGEFANEGNDNPRVIEAMGIATLRMPMLPTETPPDRREMILMAGRASYLMATRNTAAAERAFDQLASRFPETPNVHYANGVFLLQEKGEQAIAEFKRELELQPNHPWSLMQMAFEYLKQGDAATALPIAKQAVAAAPNSFSARKALGQALLDSGDAEGAIRELQAGLKMAADSPGLHFMIARAYQRAGRLEDAAREREEFTRLDRLARTQRTGAQSVGGHIEK
jgi:tetratricopeptide (TPR) repeat protein